MKSEPNCSAALDRPDSLRSLRGVGAECERQLRELGVSTPGDLLALRPRRYRDWRTPQAIASLTPGTEVVCVVQVLSLERLRGRVTVLRAEVADASGRCEALWFAQRRERGGDIVPGMRLFLHARTRLVKFAGSERLQLGVLQHRVLAADEAYVGRIWPIYPATQRLSSARIARIIEQNLDRLLTQVEAEYLPSEVIGRRRLCSRVEAWQALHRPTSPEAIVRARERLTFDTLFEVAFAAVARRSVRDRAGGALPMATPPNLLTRFEAELPFALTNAQRRVIAEIWRDCGREIAMNRLLQGDVGSGKTLVAAAAIVLAAQAGAQSALMAPTELLARQHARKLAPLLSTFGIGLEFIASSQSAQARREAYQRLADGGIAVAVGTHALLTEQVLFDRLGLAIIDEQHRFGVLQRARLRAKGGAVHTLAMTATPIPRTLAQTRYADLDISLLDQLPPGRIPVKTYLRDETAKPRIYAYVRREVAAGRQAYIVAPAIEEGESSLTGAVAEAESLREHIFPDLRVGLVHGRLSARERDELMQRFTAGAIDILVATTVIEVGVDVPNASLMVVLDAHRFGLAQLHQLRGRVGRGHTAATCILVAPRSSRRLAILTETTDGFVIAEADLELRGEGEFAGTVQAGTATLFEESGDSLALYQTAREEAEAILHRDPDLRATEHEGLRALFERATISDEAVRVTS